MLRQCIENNIDLIAIDDKYNKEYKQVLYTVQKDNNIIPLVKILNKCQARLDEKNSQRNFKKLLYKMKKLVI